MTLVSIAKFKKACQKIQYQSCAMWPSSDAKIAKTIVFMGNKNVKFSRPASIMRLLDFFKKIMVSVGVSWEGKTNIHFIDTDRAKFNSGNYIQLLVDNFSQIVGGFFLETIMYFCKMGPLLTQVG